MEFCRQTVKLRSNDLNTAYQHELYIYTSVLSLIGNSKLPQIQSLSPLIPVLLSICFTICWTGSVHWNRLQELQTLQRDWNATKEFIEFTQHRITQIETNLNQNEYQIQLIHHNINDLNSTSLQIEEQNVLKAMLSMNYISGITAHPKLEAFGSGNTQSIDPLICDEKEENLSMETLVNGWNRIKRGAQLWADEQLTNWKEVDLQSTANRNIAHPDTPYTLQPHDCLQFTASAGNQWIEIKLSQKIVPTEFVYIHIDKEVISTQEKAMAPLQFKVYGKDSKDTDSEWRRLGVERNRVLGMNDSLLKLEFVSDHSDSNQSNDGVDSMRIEWNSRDYATSTRLYRFRVSGYPA